MKITVAVPVRNEADNIGDLVRRLLTQTRPPDEIVIVDGGSTDSTADIVTDFINKGAAVKLIRAGQALPGRGRNLGAAAANSEWLAFIDAGIEPAADWLEILASSVDEDNAADVIYGGCEAITDSFFTECAAIAYLFPPVRKEGIIARRRFIASSLMKKSVWLSVGGFPEDLRSAEDHVFMNRIDSAGFKQVYEPRAIVRWHLRPTFGTTFARFVVYARNNLRAGLWRDWQARIFLRYFVLVAIAAVLLVLAPTLVWVPLALWLLMLMLRGLVAIRRNRITYPAKLGRNLKRLMLLIPLIATIDAAAFLGSIHWLCMDWRRRPRSIALEADNGA
jgi:glycosyltransferase involved in cell wall biosynthesis